LESGLADDSSVNPVRTGLDSPHLRMKIMVLSIAEQPRIYPFIEHQLISTRRVHGCSGALYGFAAATREQKKINEENRCQHNSGDSQLFHSCFHTCTG